MTDLKLNISNHDLDFSDGNYSIVSGKEQLEQHLRIKLRVFLGEWYLDISKGIDYYGEVMVQNPDLPQVDSILKSNIINTFGVKEILEFKTEFTKETRLYSVNFKVNTASDEVIEIGQEINI